MDQHEYHDQMNIVPKQPKKNSELAVAGFVLSIISICIVIPFFFVSMVLGILAVIFGIMALAKHNPKGMPITALILGGLAILVSAFLTFAVVLALVESYDDNIYTTYTTEPTKPEDYLQVEYGTFQVIEDGYIDKTELSVKITNTGDERRSFSMKIEAIDENGTRIDTDSIYITGLGPGQSEIVKVFQYIADDDIEAMKTASFHIYDLFTY